MIAALGTAAYRASLTVPFQLDDRHAIVANAAVHADRLALAPLLRAAGGPRPLASLSFAVNHALGGLDPFGYHVVNLALHLANAWLVFLVGGRLLAAAAGELAASARRRAAAIAALLFAVHPVHTQAVTYVVQRMTSLGAFFALLATLAWLRARASGGRRGGWLAAGVAAWGLALLCKENYVVLPAVLGAADALLFGGWRRGLRARWIPVVAAGAALLGLAAALAWRAREVIANMYDRFGISLAERLLTEAAVVWHYLSLLALPLPSRLFAAYDWPVARSIVEPAWTLPAILGLAAVTALAWFTRARFPLVAFAVLWWLGNLAVESSVLPLDLVFEHRVYFPSVGPLLLAAWGLERGAARLRSSPWFVAAPAIALLAIATDRRNHLWNDPLALLQQAAEGGQASKDVLLGIMAESYARGRPDDARRAAEGALRRSPENAFALTTLGHLALDAGDAGGAERYFRRAAASNSDQAGLWYGLAQALSLQGRGADAERLLVGRTGAAPGDAPAWVALAVVRRQRGDAAGARAALDRAIAADPADDLGWRYRAELSLSDGDVPAAVADLEHLVSLRPDDADARARLEEARRRLGPAPAR